LSPSCLLLGTHRRKVRRAYLPLSMSQTRSHPLSIESAAFLNKRYRCYHIYPVRQKESSLSLHNFTSRFVLVRHFGDYSRDQRTIARWCELYTMLNAQNPKCLMKSEDRKVACPHPTFAICLFRTFERRQTGHLTKRGHVWITKTRHLGFWVFCVCMHAF
jgi:hypothetical protein